MSDNIQVSIICNTYNHERYIRDALNSFLMQKTTYPFEILIHDDASTDGTADVIRAYQSKYPDIVLPIYQEENKYSQGIRISEKYQLPRARGKYIAFCEGDDYWIDQYKLQKQYDVMEEHPEIDICAHAVYKMKNGRKRGLFSPRSEVCVIKIEDVITGGGAFVGTNSLFFRKSVFDHNPKYSQIISLDYVWQIRGSLRGGMMYLPDVMSVYRIGVKDSWTDRMRRSPNKMISHTEKIKQMLIALNAETNGIYQTVIEKKIKRNEFNNLYSQGKYDELKQGEYADIYITLPFKSKLMIEVKLIFKRMKS